jgi:hypothetical protein
MLAERVAVTIGGAALGRLSTADPRAQGLGGRTRGVVPLLHKTRCNRQQIRHANRKTEIMAIGPVQRAGRIVGNVVHMKYML